MDASENIKPIVCSVRHEKLRKNPRTRAFIVTVARRVYTGASASDVAPRDAVYKRSGDAFG